MNLQFLIQNECYHTASPLRLQGFIDLCKKCGLSASKEQLEYYEKQKWFFPIARVRYPWDDPHTRNGYTQSFEWTGPYPASWHENDSLWAPQNRRFLSWKHFTSGKGYDKYQSYYSRFQVLHYSEVVARTEFVLSAKSLLSSPAVLDKAVRWRKKRASEVSKRLKAQRCQLEKIGWLCQCISDRYYPQVLTNLRRLKIRQSDTNWSWNNFRRAWNAKKELDRLGLTLDDLQIFQQRLTTSLRGLDPLYNWHDLVVFIGVEKKERLSGEARFAQQLYSMEMMIRLFYKDITGKQLPAPYYDSLTSSPHNHGVFDERSSLPYLRYTANSYSVNPQPKLILVCEGKSDKILYSTVLKDIFGYNPVVLRISFMDIKGVGNAVGSKSHDRSAALKHLIDYQHHLMTIVYVALDNEGGAKPMLQRLCKQQSIWDAGRKVTCREYAWVWDSSLEESNFSPSEIAGAMSRVARKTNLFSESDILEALKKSGGSLTALYNERSGDDKSPKGRLSAELAKLLVKECKKKENPYTSDRPVLRMLRRVVWMASWLELPNSIPEEENNRKFWFWPNEKIRDERYHDWLDEPLIDPVCNIADCSGAKKR